jgi:hypothetical protein
MQLLSYGLADRCSSRANQALTLAAFAHMALQPLVFNEWVFGQAAAAFRRTITGSGEGDRTLQRAVRRLCLAAAALMLLKATPGALVLLGVGEPQLTPLIGLDAARALTGPSTWCRCVARAAAWPGAWVRHMAARPLWRSTHMRRQQLKTQHTQRWPCPAHHHHCACRDAPEMLCGRRLCSFNGRLHLAWSVPQLPQRCEALCLSGARTAVSSATACTTARATLPRAASAAAHHTALLTAVRARTAVSSATAPVAFTVTTPDCELIAPAARSPRNLPSPHTHTQLLPALDGLPALLHALCASAAARRRPAAAAEPDSACGGPAGDGQAGRGRRARAPVRVGVHVVRALSVAERVGVCGGVRGGRSQTAGCAQRPLLGSRRWPRAGASSPWRRCWRWSSLRPCAAAGRARRSGRRA